ncbi:MAG: hypothetical protein EOP49_15300 [Sphingobacteriales bacterium]|nr:MAG: hypothetical protein EOP49_15300 [Sphingobacteriales bacterium]
MKMMILLQLLMLAGFPGGQQEKLDKGPVTARLQAAAPVFPDRLSAVFYGSNDQLAGRVDSLYELMTLQERASQMIMVATTTRGGEFATARKSMQAGQAGSMILLNGTKSNLKTQARAFNLESRTVLPPLYACDCEPSLLARKWDGSPVLTAAGEQETDDLIRFTTREIGAEMQELGVFLNFAPVVDNGSNRAIIGKRAFGKTGPEIYPRASLFIKTLQDMGIAATVKHFPGHGSVTGDSHKSAVYIDGPLTELATFRNTIKTAHPVAVMVGHITIRKNDTWGTRGLPSSISRNIVTDLLRKDIGFNGVIATDAMNMKAVSQYKDADWKAVQAGADLIVMPMNPALLHQKIVAGLQSRSELSGQLEASIKRIIRLKLSTGEIAA